MLSLRELAIAYPPARPDDPGEAIYARFHENPACALIAVVDHAGHPVGLVERNAFLTRLAGQYGRAVFGKRPIALIMDPAPLLVEADTSSGDFARGALEDHSGQLLNGFIVVEEGVYLGVGAIIDLLKAAIAERAITEKQLRGLAVNLRKSKLYAERQRRFAEAVIEHIPSLVAVRSKADGKFVMVNKAGADILGVDRQSIVGRAAADISPAGIAAQLVHADDVLGRLPDAQRRDLPFAGPDGAERLLRVAQIPVAMPDGAPLILTVAEDVTEASRALSRIEQLAHYDHLTGLPNRALFHDRLDALLQTVDAARARGEALGGALLTIDIDRFKLVNDAFGHATGDAALRAVADRIRAAAGRDHLPARLGGDEFAVLIKAPAIAAEAAVLADRLTVTLARPFEISGQTIHLRGSIGLAVYPDDAARSADLIQHADLALYRAKADGKGVWRQFDPELQAALDRRNTMERALRQAVEHGELTAHFQPILNVGQARVTGFEALARWHDPVLGQVPPGEFIPLAEEIGLIGALGEWMIRRACAAAHILPRDVTIAINISAAQFRLDGFVPRVLQMIAAAGIDPGRLEFEVTESVLVQDEAQALRSIRQLRALGVRIALDDFGTGFASLAYLKQFPFDKIKIDQGFTHGLPDDPASSAIIGAITTMAARLGMVTTAEGIETAAQLDAVVRLGCTEVQGFLIGVPAADPLGIFADREALRRLA